jgi:hypothetical protein
MSGQDSLVFLLGPVGVDAYVPRIESGQKIGQEWTLITIPASIVAPTTAAGSLDASVDGVVLSEEFFADDPTASTPTPGDFRIDFTTSITATTGTITFERGESGSVHLDVTYSGMSTVYGPSIYVVFEITTGFAF